MLSSGKSRGRRRDDQKSETPMRRLPGLLLLFFAFPASAETLDCALIKSTTNPFELTLDSTSTKEGKEPVTTQTRRQVNRKAGATIVYDIFLAPDVFLRRTYNDNAFVTETYFSKEKVRRVASYSIDVNKDYLGAGQPFDFTLQMKDDAGKVGSEVNASISYDGAVDIELGGCTYGLTKIVTVNKGTNNDKPFSNRSVAWYSRDLKTSLYSRVENSDGSSMEFRAREISTNVKPVE
jgi:hypothetical protein